MTCVNALIGRQSTQLPGSYRSQKSWKFMDFRVHMFQVWKVLESA